MTRFSRLAPGIALLVAVGLMLAGVATVFLGEESFRDQKVREVGVEAQILASTVTAALVFGDQEAAREYVGALKANPEVQAVAVYDASGALLVSFALPGAVPPPAKAALNPPRFEDGRLSLETPVMQDGARIGAVYLQTIIEPLSRRLERYGLIALMVMLAALVVGVLGFAYSVLKRANAQLEARAFQLADANAALTSQIEQREKAEEALRQSQKMEAIGQLTGGVAHDFNNLLHVIRGNIDLLKARADKSGASGTIRDFDRLVDAAVRGADRAAMLTQRLLAFSRRQPLEPKPTDANKLVAGMSDMLHRTLGERISVETILAGGLWRIFADVNQLESALLNLAVNARDAMPEGGKLTIETANTFLDEAYAAGHDEVQTGQYVMLAVTDTGTGMTKEVIAHVFEPFFTTKGVGQGTGLGLSQVYGFVKQSGGHVKIYSESGEGTTVKLYLPRLTGGAPDEERAPEATAAPAGRSQDLILVVEDDEDVRTHGVEILTDLGYGVVAAPDGPSALRILDTRPEIKLLFTDVGLPGGLNGRQLADEALRRRPDLKVLFTTGYARNAIVHQGRLDPGLELIAKPFNYATLAQKIRHLLDDEATPKA